MNWSIILAARCMYFINRYYTSVEALDFVRNKSVYDIEHCT